MGNNILNILFLPLALFIIMLGMGLTLSLKDFTRVLVYPKAVLLGLFNQLLILPFLGFLLVYYWDLSPELSVGLILVSVCPGGATSNLITHLAKADLALSITLTAISSLVTVFTIPFFLAWAMEFFLGQEASIELPFLKTILQIMAITIIPVGLGMLIKGRAPKLTKKALPAVNALSIFFFVAVVGLSLVKEGSNIFSLIYRVGLPAISLNIVTMAFGFLSSRGAKLDLRQSLTVAIETGIQNGALAIAIGLGILNNNEIAVPGAIYGLLMFLSVTPLIIWSNRNPSLSAEMNEEKL